MAVLPPSAASILRASLTVLPAAVNDVIGARYLGAAQTRPELNHGAGTGNSGRTNHPAISAT